MHFLLQNSNAEALVSKSDSVDVFRISFRSFNHQDNWVKRETSLWFLAWKWKNTERSWKRGFILQKCDAVLQYLLLITAYKDLIIHSVVTWLLLCRVSTRWPLLECTHHYRFQRNVLIWSSCLNFQTLHARLRFNNHCKRGWITVSFLTPSSFCFLCIRGSASGWPPSLLL